MSRADPQGDAGSLPRIGAHVSVAGGLDKALVRARTIGAEVIQVFPSSPRQWGRPSHDPAELRSFGQALGRARVPLFVHTIYLINLASPDPALRSRSVSALADALVFGAWAGSQGVVTHVGSHRGAGGEQALAWVKEALIEAAGRAREERGPEGRGAPPGPLPPVLLETSAGSANSLGGDPAELGRLLADVPLAVGVCLDTAHLLAAGFPVHTPEGIDSLLAALDTHVGLERVGLVHLNDSKTDVGSRRDRHENLWEGRIGRAGLALWVQRRELRGVPFVLETPGFGKEGPDRKNLNRAKRLRSSRHLVKHPG